MPLPVDAAAVEVAREVQDILRSGGGGEAAGEDVAEEFPGSLGVLCWQLCVGNSTGILSHLWAKLRDWAIRQAGAGCYSWAAFSSNDSRTRYTC